MLDPIAMVPTIQARRASFSVQDFCILEISLCASLTWGRRQEIEMQVTLC